MGARPLLVAPLVATVVTGCLLRPTGVHQSDASVDARPHADGGGGGGGGGPDAGGGSGGGPMDAVGEAGTDAAGEGGSGNADPCAAALTLTADSVTCTMHAMQTGANSATATATNADENCVWGGATLTGADPSASVLVTAAPSTGHAYLKVKLGTQADVSLYVTDSGGMFSPSPGVGWGSAFDPGVGIPTQICIRIRVASGTVIGEYDDPVNGWQPFATANETLDAPVAVTVGAVSSSVVTAKATFSELGTGTP